MNKVTIISTGKRADIGSLKIDRVLPNRYVNAIGPFVFLDHILPAKEAEGTGPHPHRGIATLTYVLKGIAEHYDSKGHHAIVTSGGVQWMKAGNGIIHDETIKADADQLIHSFQFWINLPAEQKAEPAAYLPLQATEIPTKQLENGIGWIKVIAGDYENAHSKIPAYSRQFIYHVHLEGATSFCLPTHKDMEYAVFLPLQDLVINDADFHAGEFISFEKGDGSIELKNLSTLAADMLVFGGEPYTEPIASAGPFVMNTQHEITIAYNDFYDGKYGEILF